MAGDFAEKVVLVAGGTGGLGRAVALAFLDGGASVMVTYRNPDELAALKQAAGPRATMLQGFRIDVTSEAEVAQMSGEILAGHKRLDVLVNAVGGYAGGTPVWLTTVDVFDRMFALNLRAGYVLSRVLVPEMLKQRSGAIVNVSSRSAVDHAAGAGAYAASKAASTALFDCLAADLKGTGIRVNSILPSIIDTEANRRAMPDADFAQWPKAEDIARVILFLCSDNAKLIHGAVVPVYGAN